MNVRKSHNAALLEINVGDRENVFSVRGIHLTCLVANDAGCSLPVP